MAEGTYYKTARERFAAAVQAVLWDMPKGTWRREHMLAMVDAFADAECDDKYLDIPTRGGGTLSFKVPHKHEECRASLRC